MTKVFRTEAPADTLRGSAWRKSSYSGAVGNCVELSRLHTGNIAIRNSRDEHGPALVWTRSGVAGLLAALKAGEVDGPGA